MHYFLEITFIFVLFATAGYFSCFNSRIGFSERISLGTLLLYSTSNLGLYIFEKNQAPLILLPLAVLALLFVSNKLLKLWNIEEFLPARSSTATTSRLHIVAQSFSYLALFGVLFFLTYTITGNGPDSGIQFFQGWHPSFIKASLELQKVVLAESSDLGKGFLTSAKYYAPNSLGLMLLVNSLFSSLSSWYIYVASSLYLFFLGSFIICNSFSKEFGLRYLAIFQVIFCVAFSNRIQYWFTTLASDEVLIFSFCVALLFVNKLVVARKSTLLILKAAALALAFACHGRNYGFFYFAIFVAALTGITLYKTKPLKALFGLIPLGFLPLVQILPDVVTFLQTRDLFYPRPNLSKIHTFDFANTLQGIVSDIGLWEGITWVKISFYSFGYILLLVPLLLRQTLSAKLNYLKTCSWVLFIIFLPIILELLTGYRKSLDMNKIYVGSYVALIFLPLFIIQNWLLELKAPKQRNFFVAFSFLALVTWNLTWPALETQKNFLGIISYKDIQNTIAYRRTPTDKDIADKIITTQASLNSDVINRQIMYFHYENGLSVRSHLGGYLFKDLDFWSDNVQARLNDTSKVKDLLIATSCPNVYLPNPQIPPHYQAHVVYKYSESLWNDIASGALDKVSLAVIESGPSKFYIIDPSLCN